MQVFTDGACSGNPGPGGWGWVTPEGLEGSGSEAHSTNQRMEVQAVLEAIRALPGPLEVNSDSTYVVNCFNDRWYEGWRKRGWRNSQKKPVANRDLWEPLIEEVEARGGEITFVWVKGHSGNELNDRADALAVAEVDKIKQAAKDQATSGDGKTDSETAIAVPWDPTRAIWIVGSTTPDNDQLAQLRTTMDALERDNADSIVISGLRRGCELAGAEIALELGIPLGAILPFADPAGGWPADDQARFDRTFDAAEWTVTLAGNRATPGPAVQERNRWMSSAAYAAVVVQDSELTRQLDEAGVTVIEI